MSLHVWVPQLPQAWVVLGAQTPWPLHAPSVHCPQASQVSVSVPQLPQGTVRFAPGVQTGAEGQEQTPHAQVAEQLWVPYVLQDWVVPAAQAPPPEQAPHSQEAPHVWVPQLPQLWVAPAAQAPPPEQAPHSQEAPHVWVPQLPQLWVAPAAQTPPGHVPPQPSEAPPHLPAQLGVQHVWFEQVCP